MYLAPWQKRLDNLAENHGHCEFIGALLAPLIASVLPEAVAGATILGTAVPEVIGGALGSAAIGAGISGLTGGNPLLGALGGGLSGGIGAFGPALGAATGIGTTAGDILAGVGGGLLSSEITGSNPLTGALIGGATGALSGVLGPSASTAGATSTATTAPGGGAAATVAPSSGGTPSSAAALGDTAANTTTGTSITGSPTPGPGGSPVSGANAPTTVGTVSQTSTTAATPATTGGGLYGSNWATPAQVSEGWGSVAAAGGSPLAPTPSFLDSLKSTVTGDITKLISSPTALLAGGLLGYEMLSGGLSNNTAADTALQQQATSAATTATMLQAPLRSGVLPPGAQSTLDLSQQNQEAQARSVYASMGMGASTGQADALSAISERIAADKFGIENMLFNEAGPYAQLAANDDVAILNQQRAEDQQFTSALTSFVAALAGSKSGTSAVA